MLAERVIEWTREWKQEGFEEGLQEGLQQGLQQATEETAAVVRRVLFAKLEQRFGPLPAEVRRRLESIGSVEDLAELVSRSGTASSLASLGLS